MKELTEPGFQDLSADQNWAEGSHIELKRVGFVLEKTIAELNQVHHQYLRNTPNQVWFPYSYTGEWTRQGYVISNQMTRTSQSKQAKPMVNFAFVYDNNLKNISDEDMDAILDNLKKNSSKRIQIKTMLKEHIMAAQNQYYNNEKLIKEYKEHNQQSRQQIEIKRKEIEELVKVITSTTQRITTEEVQVIEIQKQVNDLDDQISLILERIKIKEEELKKAQTELSDFKPYDKTNEENQLKIIIQSIGYPEQYPQKFDDEWAKNTVAKNQLIKDNYANCKSATLADMDLQKLMKCYQAVQGTIAIKRKLRRNFF